MRHREDRYHASPWWRTVAVGALVSGLLCLGWVALGALYIPRDGASLGEVAVMTIFGAAGLVAFVFALRRFTERVELKADTLKYSVLGRSRSIRYADVTSVAEHRPVLITRPVSPRGLLVVRDAHGEAVVLNSYFERFGDLVREVKSRVDEGVQTREASHLLADIAQTALFWIVGALLVVFILLLLWYALYVGPIGV
jgi:Na+/melibiose symporter-like transporter